MMLTALVALSLAMPPSAVSSPPRASAAAEPNHTLGPDEVRARVHAYLGSIDTPITQAQWRALGDGAVPVLEETVADTKLLSLKRGHALDALGVVSPSRAVAHARMLAPDPRQSYSLRASAVGVLERHLQGEELRSFFTPLLQDPDVRFRARAATALARTGRDCGLVRAQLAQETVAHQGYFRAALVQCP